MPDIIELMPTIIGFVRQHFWVQVGVFVLFCVVTVLFVGIIAGFLFRDAVKTATKDEEKPKTQPHEPMEPA